MDQLEEKLGKLIEGRIEYARNSNKPDESVAVAALVKALAELRWS